MNDFQEALARFRGAMIQEGERSPSPDPEAILKLERRFNERRRLRWA